MRLPSPELPTTGVMGPFAAIVSAMNKYLKMVQVQVNGLGDGSISAQTSASTGPPPANSTTVYAKGDFIRNSSPAVTGTAGAQYIILGWLCTVAGKPGTWVPCRVLTGT